MSKQIKVDLLFTANTNQAKTQLQQLSQTLNSLTSVPAKFNLPITKELQEAQAAAAALKVALQQAVNADTGKFDLSKFSTSLKAMGTDINQLKMQLSGMGPAGQVAFQQLAQSVIAAEIPVQRTNEALVKLGTTLKNTLRWQISSSILQGFMSAVSGAYQYAQDLNESLNNIRIVTGQNIDQMSRFALQANKAAKALNTTTTEYTDASLIYYQQGLSDAEVAERTKVTVKLANVSRESAETVSEWMTAIWNNFQDGTESLEKYADVITALGAATASSADEIAQGLEKFSAVANTVGLSYEYATAALATVTSQTRQSADVVGTAFKTLFARLEGLQLGETLEDGVTLNKYSSALEAIGINILSANGELKAMDSILNELGARWDTLSKAQQVALAQTVGGMRQYNQLIALMDNWEDFQQNVLIAENSGGSLQEQADIYAEGWEAAEKRVQAAAEAIYSDLINDEFFIDILNGFEKILTFVDKLIDSMGGFKGLLTGVSSILLNTFNAQAVKGIENLAYNLKSFVGLNAKQAMQIKEQMYQAAITPAGTMTGQPLSAGQVAQQQAMKSQLDLQIQMQRSLESMPPLQQQLTQELVRQNQIYAEQAIAAGQKVDLTEQELSQARNRVKNENFGFYAEGYTDQALRSLDIDLDLGDKIAQEIQQASQAFTQGKISLEEYQASLNKLYQSADKRGLSQTSNYIKSLTVGANGKSLSEETIIARAQGAAGNGSERAFTFAQQDALAKAEKKLAGSDSGQALEAYVKSSISYRSAVKENAQATENLGISTQETTELIKKATKTQGNWAQTVVNAAQAAMSLSFAISSLISLGDTWADDTLSVGEKLLQTFMSLGMAIPMLVNGMTALKTVWATLSQISVKDTISRGLNAATTWLQAKAAYYHSGALAIEKQATKESTVETDRNTASLVANKVARTKNGDAGLKQLGNSGSSAQNVFSGKLTGVEATKAGGKGFWANAGTALKGFGKAVVAALPVIAALAASIATIAILVDTARDQILKYQWSLERAQKAHKMLSENYAEFTQEVQDFKTAISEYDSGIDAINRLTEGTLEYKEALIAANDKALDLINTYGIMNYTVDQNGAIIIDQNELDQAYEKKLQEQVVAQNAMRRSEQLVKQKQLEKDRSDLTRQIWSQKDFGTVAGNALVAGGAATGAGALAGTALTSWSGPGALIGAIAGSVIGLVGGTAASLASGISSEQEEKGLQAILDAVEKDPNALKSKGIAGILQEEGLSGLIEVFEKNESAIEELVESSKQLKNSNFLLNDTMATAIANERGKKGTIEDAAESGFINKQMAENTGAYAEAEEFVNSLTWNSAAFWDLYIKFVDQADNTKVKYEEWAGEGATRVVYNEETHEWEKGEANAVAYESIVSGFSKAIGDALVLDPNALSDAIGEMNWSTAQDELKNKAAGVDIEAIQARIDALQKRTEALKQTFSKTYLDEDDIAPIAKNIEAGQEINLTHLTRAQLAVLEKDLPRMTTALGQETADAIQTAINNYDNALARNNILNSSNQSYEKNLAERTANLQSKYELSANDLENYYELLSITRDISKEYDWWTKLWAINRLEVYDFVKSTSGILEEIEDASTDSPEYIKAIGQVEESLNALIGKNVNLGADFVIKNTEKIKAALAEGGAAAEELFDEIQVELIASLDLEKGIEDNLQNKLNAVEGLEVKVGASLARQDAGKVLIEELNKQISAGKLEYSDAESILKSYGYQVDDEKAIIKRMSALDGSGEKEIKLIGDATYMGIAELFGEMIAAVKEEAKDLLKDLRAEIIRYFSIDEVIDDISRNLDKLSRAKDRAFGADRIAIMEAELEALDAQSAAYEEKINQAKQWQEFDKQRLAELGAEYEFEAKYDADGRLQNYEEMHQKIINSVNPNNSEKLQEDYNKFEEYVNQYKDTLNTIEELNDEFQENEIAKFEKRLEIIDYSIEANVELNERSVKNLERQLKDLTDELFDAPERIGLMAQQTAEEFKNIGIYTEGIKKTLKAAGVENDADIEKYLSGGDLTSIESYNLTDDVMQKLMDYTDGLTDSYSAIQDLREAIEEGVVAAFEAGREEIEKTGQAFTTLGSIINNYKNIVDVLGKDRLGLSDAILKDLNAAADKAARGNFETTIADLEYVSKSLEQARKDYEDAKGTEGEEFFKSEVERLEQELNSATEASTAAWAFYLEQITNSFQENMAIVLNTFEDTIAGMTYRTLNELQTAFNREQEIADLYAEDYKKIYELNKLNRDINKSIDSTDNLKIQRSLKDLQAEINAYQAAGKKMSQYELDVLRKKYDLRVAEIALEEAQKAKSQVRLTRDSAGNWGYVYTTSESAIADTSQKYEDALYAWQELNDNQVEQLQSNIIQNRIALTEALNDLSQQKFASDEEFYRAQEELIAYYSEKERFYLEQLGLALDNSELNFTDTILSVKTGYMNLEDFGESLKQSIGSPGEAGTLLGDTATAYADWGAAINEAMQFAQDALTRFGGAGAGAFGENSDAQNAIGSFEDFLIKALYGDGGSRNSVKGGIVGGLDDTIKSLGDVANKAAGVFSATQTRASEWYKQFGSNISKAKGDVDNLNLSLQKLIDEKTQIISITTADTITTVQEQLDNILKTLTAIAKHFGALNVPNTGTNSVGQGKGALTFKEGQLNPDPEGPPVDLLANKLTSKDNIAEGQGHYPQNDIISSPFAIGQKVKIKDNSLGKGAYGYHKAYLLDGTRVNGNETTLILTDKVNGQKIENVRKISDSLFLYQTTAMVGSRYWLSQHQLSAFDTGGYTGAWGPDGRLAMLHQKELVLNSQDTENFLTAVEIVRSLNDRLEQNALFASQGLGAISSAFTLAAQSGTLEQQVTIHAEFPNVNDHNEIELALNNLVNEASQRANRK